MESIGWADLQCQPYPFSSRNGRHVTSCDVTPGLFAMHIIWVPVHTGHICSMLFLYTPTGKYTMSCMLWKPALHNHWKWQGLHFSFSASVFVYYDVPITFPDSFGPSCNVMAVPLCHAHSTKLSAIPNSSVKPNTLFVYTEVLPTTLPACPVWKVKVHGQNQLRIKGQKKFLINTLEE